MEKAKTGQSHGMAQEGLGEKRTLGLKKSVGGGRAGIGINLRVAGKKDSPAMGLGEIRLVWKKMETNEAAERSANRKWY